MNDFSNTINLAKNGQYVSSNKVISYVNRGNTAHTDALLSRKRMISGPLSALAFAMRDMADETLLCSQRGICGAAEKMGYRFAYPTLASALSQLVTSSQ